MSQLTLGTSKERTPEEEKRRLETLKNLLGIVEPPSLADFLAKDHPRKWLDNEFEPPLEQAIDKMRR